MVSAPASLDGMTAAPIIVTALFDPASFAWFDRLRKAHYPPEQNQLDAHLTLFHHLPPSVAPELHQRMSTLVCAPRPAAEAAGLINLGRGVAIRIQSPALAAIRQDLAAAFAPLLTPQDAAGWRPHVTIQNKVTSAAARALRDELAPSIAQRPVGIVGLAMWWYRGGPWELIARHPFRR